MPASCYLELPPFKPEASKQQVQLPKRDRQLGNSQILEKELVTQIRTFAKWWIYIPQGQDAGTALTRISVFPNEAPGEEAHSQGCKGNRKQGI